ncbi:hypothetical protein [Leucobacter luti]|uniref:hypothetical protein n=1 Tax=Leucobacter luti TaxID=340320 RepID=UPI001A9EDC7E|nr:hypothetical protein [Leucobacter luti]
MTLAIVALVGGSAAIFIGKLAPAAPEIALPAGFPAQRQLPLVQGNIVAAADLAGRQSSVTIAVADYSSQKSALTELADAGFVEIGSRGDGPTGTVTSLSGQDFAVRVVFDHSEARGYTVTYLASPADLAGASTAAPDSSTESPPPESEAQDAVG